MSTVIARHSWLTNPWSKPLLWGVALMPLAWLIGRASAGAYVNPEEALVRGTGDWALRMLLLTLAVTPARVSLHLPQLLRFRRSLGQLSFVYACVHLSLYLWLIVGFESGKLVHDLARHPYVFAGMATFVCMLPLGLTSSNAAIRALGAARWQLLHRLVYVVAALAMLHFFWVRASKNQVIEPMLYAAVLGGLLAWRLWYWNRNAPAGGCGH
ncbi:sulfite oxidase heme-binding subunit YedZ [Brachymonas sp. M4Q-1]|uniref:sulfite oxidase heme-binding subunit YedZ n=1 Tax=Brachymonas sp. M4Q-1 TaxID=3416906 RepID=UPI003CEE75D5